MIYLISYDLLKATERDYSPVYEAIKKVGPWWHYLESTWIVQTQQTVDAVAESIHDSMRQGDRLFVVQIDNRNRNGWLPKDAWDWIRTHEQATNS